MGSPSLKKEKGSSDWRKQSISRYLWPRAKECEKEAREPCEVETGIFESRQQELSGHMDEQVTYHHIQSFVAKYSKYST